MAVGLLRALLIGLLMFSAPVWAAKKSISITTYACCHKAIRPKCA